jgi:hypothetical protein
MPPTPADSIAPSFDTTETQASPANFHKEDYVVLYVTEKPGRLIRGAVVLPEKSRRSDEQFFRALREKYKELRGIRKWFSLTEFNGFRYVKVCPAPSLLLSYYSI